MSDYMLTVPEDIYARARRIAEETAQPVDQVMLEYLRTLSIPLPNLPPEEEAELEALKNLSDDALWTIAREQMADVLQARMQGLMDKNSAGTITPAEYAELEALVERGQRLMVRKSEAAALLTQRGYTVTPKDMTARE
ncbi:MAG: hypothetical protein KC547_05060 [Anaerolineae bacterium]|nr:hypothetical protein [Anaerolineae bacterium]